MRLEPHVSGSQPTRPGAGKLYRGSRKRIRRLKWQEHTPVDLWTLAALTLVMSLVLISWLSTHAAGDHHHSTETLIGSR